MTANQKRLVSYGFAFCIAIIIGGACAAVVVALKAPGLTIAGAFAAGFLGIMGVAVKVIGPFDFNDDNAPPPAEQEKEHSAK
ncbi:hypothetical protein D9753_16220 [Streptomyces dangxiongensis]|uniref:Uncharacterized protein n=1 Tax=Streptomyces dangxiongensis TaxID=1442032 RepID=A0A3G2JKX2_9ACTN|nr:hypothetical protein [Streptomyces dangxiongensis]AYN40207.1 hypothetical protein D9753_16220 [Streptomyces dangxiongensis]